MDRDLLEYNIASIRRNPNKPYRYNNMELASEEYPFIKEEFPHAMLFCINDAQYIIVNEKARKDLVKRLDNTRRDLASALRNTERILYDVNNVRLR